MSDIGKPPGLCPRPRTGVDVREIARRARALADDPEALQRHMRQQQSADALPVMRIVRIPKPLLEMTADEVRELCTQQAPDGAPVRLLHDAWRFLCEACHDPSAEILTIGWLGPGRCEGCDVVVPATSDGGRMWAQPFKTGKGETQRAQSARATARNNTPPAPDSGPGFHTPDQGRN